MKKINLELIKKVFIKTLPIMTGYLAMGTGFGIYLSSKGYGLIWSFAMGVFIYAGSMQYLSVNLLATQEPLISVALTTLMVNARHMFYGISVLNKYKNLGNKKIYTIFGLTDETYSIICTENLVDEEDKSNLYFFITLFNHIYWVIGCVLGSILSSTIQFNTMGIDFAMTALFITVATEQWLSTKNHNFAIVGFVSSILCILLFKADNFLIPSMILIVFILSIFRKNEKTRGEL